MFAVGFDFGNTPVGCGAVWRELFVCGLTVTAVYADPPGSPFAISAPPARPLQPGETHCFTVSYEPATAAQHQGLLVFETTAQSAAFMTVPVLGMGVAAPNCNQ